MRDRPDLVSASDLQALQTGLKALSGDANEGFFGPGSVTWKVNRECAVFLGAGRAALLQLAHPWVSAALVGHSNLMNDAIGRFHSTFRVIYTMLFGSREQALLASSQLYRRHSTIEGRLPSSIGAYPAHEPYAANEVNALRWVFATLVESAVLAHELVLPALSSADREQFYAESYRMAALCGIPPASLPPTWADLVAYTGEMMASPLLAVDADARAMGQAVLSGVGTWVQAPRWYRALTAYWLPPNLREGFGLPFSAAEQRSLSRAIRLLPRLYPWLPRPIRYVGPYREARARLEGRQPASWTRRSNRFWMGVPRLLYAVDPSPTDVRPSPNRRLLLLGVGVIVALGLGVGLPFRNELGRILKAHRR